MAEKSTDNIAESTEIPVDQAPISDGATKLPDKSPLEIIKNIPIKFVAIVGVLALVIMVSIVAFVAMKNEDTQTEDVNSLGEKAVQAINAGNYDEAEDLINQGFQITQGSPEFLAQKINVISLKGNRLGIENEQFEESKKFIEAGLLSYPDNPQVLQAAGYAYETAGDYEKALELYDNALVLSPNSSDLHFHRGHVMEFMGRPEEAYIEYDKAESLNPNNPLVLLVQGRRYAAINDKMRSYDYFDRVAKQDNIANALKAEALSNASIMKRGEVKLQEAEDLGKKAVEADPTFSPGLGAYGYVLAINGKSEGITYLEKAIAANPRITQHYWHLGQLKRISQNFDASISYLQQALERLNNDNTILSNEVKQNMRGQITYDLALTYYEQENFDLAVSTLILAVQFNPVIKQKLQGAYSNYGTFSGLTNNNTFLSLLN